MPKNWCFWIVVLEKTLESPLDCKEIQPVNPKGNSPEYSLERLMLNLKLQSCGHLMWTVSLENTLRLEMIEGRRTGQQKVKWLHDTIFSMDMSLNKLWEIVKDKEAWCAAVYGITKSWMQLSDWAITTTKYHVGKVNFYSHILRFYFSRDKRIH